MGMFDSWSARGGILSAAALVTTATSFAGCERSVEGGPIGPGSGFTPPTEPAVVPVADGGSAGPSAPLRLDKLVTAADPPPPVSGGTLALSPDGAFAVAADSDRDRVDVIDLGEHELVGTVELAEDSEPGRVVVDASGLAHVALRGGGVARIDVAQANLLGISEACRHPRGLALDETGEVLFVGCLGGSLLQLNAADHRLLDRTHLGEDLRDVVSMPQGMFVSRYRRAEVLALGADGSVAASERPELGDDTFEELFGGLLADGGTSFQDGEPVPVPPDGFPVSREATLAARMVGNDDMLVMLHQGASTAPVGVEPGGYGGGGGCGGAIVEADISVKRAGQPLQRGVGLADSSVPVDVALSPDGQEVAVASYGQWLVHGRTLQVFSLDSLEGGSLESPPGSCAFPTARHEGPGQTVAVAYGPDGTLYALSREPHLLAAYERSTVTGSLLRMFSVELGGESVADTAHDLFHGNVGQGIACASCHGELTDDAHVWLFAELGARRTQNMRGGLLGTEPFHWSGDMDDIHMLVEEVMEGRMGGVPLEEATQAALGEWIDAQPALVLEPEDAEAVARGEALFESSEVGCASCHSGPKKTNNTTVDVGTGELFQVPSLLGLGWRAPYMHDGCAETLRERFEPECGGGDQHGKTSHLSESELNDLIAYLKSL